MPGIVGLRRHLEEVLRPFMIIGILSDSHGRAKATASAVKALLDHGAGMLIHLGDIETEAVIDELVGHNARIVLGNCDWDEENLIRYARHVDVAVDHPMGVIEVAGKRIAFTHGHLPQLMQQALAEGVDYLLHGHTHQPRNERMGRTRIINPGALFRAARYTAAVLNPETDALDFVVIEK
jgi:uncharacterized protein